MSLQGFYSLLQSLDKYWRVENNIWRLVFEDFALLDILKVEAVIVHKLSA